MHHLMLDLETMGTRYGSVITQVGACFFDPKTAEVGDKFLMNISMTDSLAHGFTVDSGAIHFWMGQTVKTWMEEPRVEIRKFMTEFNWFTKNAKKVWSHATFDFSLLTMYYEKLNEKMPFHYSTTRDIRTLVDLAGPDFQKADDAVRKEAHDALADCLYQVKYVCKALEVLRKRNVCSS